MDEEQLESKIEEIIDRKLEQKLQDGGTDSQTAEEVKQETQQELKEDQEEGLSRRKFLKTLGAGAAGIGAMSLIPSVASKVTITDTGVKKDGTNALWQDGSTTLNSSFDFNQKEATALVLENRTSAPGSPVTGQIWFDTDG